MGVKMANEKRLIDANEVERKLKIAISSWWRDCNSNAPVIARAMEDALQRVIYAPTVDAVVLPCKIGDTLYDIYEAVGNGGDKIKEYNVSTIEIKITKNGRAFLVIENIVFQFDDFGKTVFLTQEEAEAALAKMDGERK